VRNFQWTECYGCSRWDVFVADNVFDWNILPTCEECGCNVFPIDHLHEIGPVDQQTALRQRMFPYPYREMRGLTGVVGHYEREQKDWNRLKCVSVRVNEFADAESIESAAVYFDDLAA